MFFTKDRQQMRQYFYDSWKKYQAKLPMEPMENLIGETIAAHPEYHPVLERDGDKLNRDYFPEVGDANPFLHLALHIALREQLTTNRPDGVRDAHQALAAKLGDLHQVEHVMIDCLWETLSRIQRQNEPYNDAQYLGCLRRLAQS